MLFYAGSLCLHEILYCLMKMLEPLLTLFFIKVSKNLAKLFWQLHEAVYLAAKAVLKTLTKLSASQPVRPTPKPAHCERSA